MIHQSLFIVLYQSRYYILNLLTSSKNKKKFEKWWFGLYVKPFEYKAILSEKKQISPDSYIFRFSLPKDKEIIPLKVGQHVQIFADIFDEKTQKCKNIRRSYTPTSLTNQNDYFDIPIKIYSKTDDFPNGGLLTQYLDNLNIGDTIDLKGPTGRLSYEGNGTFTLRDKDKILFATRRKTYKNIAMIAGGTGITPMLQIIQYICQNENQQSKINLNLLFANRTEDDILLRDALDSYQKEGQLNVTYTIDKSIKQDWNGQTGFITESMIKKYLPEASDDTLFLICGPKPMNKLVLNILKKINVKPENIHKF